MNDDPIETSIARVITVRFKFEDGDWCNCAVDESSGQFSISSMDFHFGYRWNIGSNLGGEPPYTLLKGLDGFCVDYIATKLGSGNGEAYDPELTEAAVREIIEKARGRLPGDEAEQKELGIEVDLQTINFASQDAFLHTAPEWLEEPWQLIRTSLTRKHRLLRERYLLAFKAWAREQVRTFGVQVSVAHWRKCVDRRDERHARRGNRQCDRVDRCTRQRAEP